ncbi:MAG: Hsp20 family protein, partial [Oscillospiraceae bacterium]|nr:Hsp20 family protein [Oscillospiraceae bacterium]
NKKGKLVHQERYSGSMSRSFYIGESLTEDDVKAKFEDGVLTLDFPKEKAIKLPERKTIQIEGSKILSAPCQSAGRFFAHSETKRELPQNFILRQLLFFHMISYKNIAVMP